MVKTKMEQFEELTGTEIWKDFCKHEVVDGYLEAITNDYTEEHYYIIDKETLYAEMEWYSDSVHNPDELCYIQDMLHDNPKEVYKLRRHIRYYLNKWKSIKYDKQGNVIW